jgi:hypothetical protein
MLSLLTPETLYAAQFPMAMLLLPLVLENSALRPLAVL